MAIITTTNAFKHRHRRIVDVLDYEFGCSYATYSHGHWKPNSTKYVVWFPKVSLAAKGRNDTDWLELFTDKTLNELTVVWAGDKKYLAQREKYASSHINDLQVVFANIHGTVGYEFVGVYQCTGKDAHGVRHYERVATSIDTVLCPPRPARQK